MKTETFELWALVDSAGDYATGRSAEEARTRYEEDIQPLADCDGMRLVKLALAVPLPLPVEMTGDVPAQGSASLTLAE